MLKFRLLGGFAVDLDGTSIEVASRPAQSLLAYLLLNPGIAHRRERLAGLLWPDSSETNARRNLRQALWQIRRALGELSDTLLTADDITITLHQQGQCLVDTATIGRNLDEPAPLDDLLAVAATYGGELLPGFYDEWAVLERQRLQAQFERKMNLLLGELLHSNRWADVLQWGEHWIALGHTPEPAYRALMLAHASLGDTASAADVYRRCVEALDRELGVEPSTQTQALYQRLRTGAAPAVKTRIPTPSTSPVASATVAPPVEARRHNLPIALTSFIGREKEITEIQRLLLPQSATVRLLTLTGPGGTGKTRLALQVAQGIGEVQGRDQTIFPDGIWLVELASLADPELIVQTITTVLNIREEPNTPPIQVLIEYLRAKALLLILDNCEHLVESCAQLVEAILRVCPRVKILATGRETLGVTGETVFRVPSLSLPDPRQLAVAADLTQYEAVRLFVARASTVKPEFALTTANANAIAQICQQLDGVPLAIELAAARVRAMTAEQIAARLDDRFRLLTGGSRTALPRQQTLRALIDWSWDLLTQPEQILLRRLAVFLGGWTVEAAEFVCVDDEDEGSGEKAQPIQNLPIQNFDVLPLLTNLIEKSLVLVEEQADAARYRLLETIRQYAREKLLDAGESSAVRARHLTYFVQLAEQADPQLRMEQQFTWLARLEMEHDNLRAALKWATSSGALETSLCLAGNLARFWYLHGYWKEGREWLRLVLAKSAQAGAESAALTSARIKALNGAGWLADEDGSEISFYRESLALCRQIGDRWGEAFALRGLAASRANQLTLSQRKTYLDESLQLFRTLQADWGIALALLNAGWLALDSNQSREAETAWQESLLNFQRCGDAWGIAVIQNALGYAARLRGEYEQAKRLTNQSLDNFARLGDKAGIALSFVRLGNLAYRRGDYGEATALLQEGLQIQYERGDQEGIINALALLGMVACYQGNFAEATLQVGESVALAKVRGRAEDIVQGLSHLAFVAYMQGNLALAGQLFQESLDFARQGPAEVELAYALYGLGLTKMRLGEHAEADQHLNASLNFWQQWGDQRYIAALFDALGKLAQAQGDRASAQEHFWASWQIRKQMVDKQGMIESLEQWASVLALDKVSVQMVAAAAALRLSIGAPVPPIERTDYERLLAALRSQLGEAAFTSAWAAGSAKRYEQLIAWVAEREN